jgi:hypothetical protein
MENGKREFWFWPVFFAAMTYGIFLFYQSCKRDREVWDSSQEIRVQVIDKRLGHKSRDSKIGIRHGLIPIYVYAGKRWFRQAKIDSMTTVKYSAKYHAYMDPSRRFGADKGFLWFLIIMDLIILWRSIWLGLYIWYWKQPGV